MWVRLFFRSLSTAQRFATSIWQVPDWSGAMLAAKVATQRLMERVSL
jgi:hypothetical protein